jgi:hypothetical protein
MWSVTRSAMARMNIGESFSDSARDRVTPSYATVSSGYVVRRWLGGKRKTDVLGLFSNLYI